MSDYYDPYGRPMEEDQYAASFAYDRHIGESILRLRGRVYRVSTIWLGLDHGWGISRRPIIFETMIFEGNGSTDLATWRYSTAQQAMRGHIHAVRWLKRNVREVAHPQLIHNGAKPRAVGRPTANRKRK